MELVGTNILRVMNVGPETTDEDIMSLEQDEPYLEALDRRHGQQRIRRLESGRVADQRRANERVREYQENRPDYAMARTERRLRTHAARP